MVVNEVVYPEVIEAILPAKWMTYTEVAGESQSCIWLAGGVCIAIRVPWNLVCAVYQWECKRKPVHINIILSWLL